MSASEAPATGFVLLEDGTRFDGDYVAARKYNPILNRYVPAMARFILHERVARSRWIGSGVVALGVGLVVLG